MATNKHAQIRYQALDRCFSNFNRRFFIEDLIEACSQAIYEFDGIEDGVKRRQIFDDIRYMESEAGWAVPLVRHKEGRRVYYRYDDKEFSINKQPITETEANQLRDTITLLSRFQGMPQLEWIDEISVRLESQFNLSPAENRYVSFESNPFLSGLQHFNPLFRAIQHKSIIKIKYQGFRQIEEDVMIIHPYFLKQYNSRWFLFGWNEKFESISNLAIDRIISFEEIRGKFRENDIDFSDYFDDIVGVTLRDFPVEEVIIQIDKNLWPYIESKPIHGSQTVLERNDEYTLIKLQLQVNYELTSLLLSYGYELKIIQPAHLKGRMLKIIAGMTEKYLDSSEKLENKR